MSELLRVKRERWTEDDVLSFPPGEHNYFDRKSGLWLSEPEFNKKMGKALSAFANSGGGYLLLGVRNDGSFDGVPKKRGNTDTREWLEQKIPDLVSYPLQDFMVHEVVRSSPSGIPAGSVVIVIDVGDSDLAPHQNASDNIYYCRMGSCSVPATHFYLQLLWQRQRYPTGKVVRAWLDTVINRVISVLDNEAKTISEKGWAWDRFKQTIEGLRTLSYISLNSEQFLLSYSQVRDLLKSHDDAVLHLRDRISEYYEAIKSSDELKAVYDEATQPEMIRKMAEAYPHALSYYHSDADILQGVLGPDEERLPTLSEAIVNERGVSRLGSGWGPAPFWNLHREALITVARGEKFVNYRHEVETAWTELVSIIESTQDCLKDIRDQLTRKHGEPYELETASFGAPPTVSGFLGLR